MTLRTLDDLFFEMDNASQWKRANWALRRLVGRIKRAPRSLQTNLICAKQRVFRGWDDRSVWSLDNHIAKQVGEQLCYMADIAHGWPGEYYGTFEDWVNDLRRHGTALQEYNLRKDYEVANDALRADAKIALYWVADNFGALWD